MESWRHCWRHGVAPLLSSDGLEALRRALLTDDERLIQGHTCREIDGAVAGCCPVAYVGWRAVGLRSRDALEEYFLGATLAVGERLGEPSGMRWLTQWWDESPREEARRHLLAEVNRNLAERLAATERVDGVEAV